MAASLAEQGFELVEFGIVAVLALKPRGAFKLLMHCNTSGPELARRLAELGAWFSVSGIATFKAAEDVREKIAAIRPTFRDEVKEPRVLRFDPASRAIWSVAVLPAPTLATSCAALPPGGAIFPRGGPSEKCLTSSPIQPMSAVELTNWADQVLKKRLENVRGAGSVTLVGGTKREINVYLNPQAMESLGITADQVVNAVRNENQDLPVGAIRSLAQERVVKIDARMKLDRAEGE